MTDQTTITDSPEALQLAMRTSEQGAKARRLGKELARASQTIANLRGRVSFWKAENARNLDAIRRLRQSELHVLARRVLALADEWEAIAGLTRATLPADGAYDSTQCQQDGATEALTDAARQLRDTVNEPTWPTPARFPTFFQHAPEADAGKLSEQLLDAIRRHPGVVALPPSPVVTTAGDRARDSQLVATAERLGDEVGQRDQTAAIESAATTLRAHQRSFASFDACACGWTLRGTTHARHVAEQLAAVGALAGAS